MTTPETAEVIYEVEATLDPAIVPEFDAWLPGHVREVIACTGFTGAEIQSPTVPDDGPPCRRVQYRLESQAALDRYLAEDAPRLRADGAARFGDQVRFSRKVLSPTGVPLLLPPAPFLCRNCGAAVPGHYCAECGQSRDIRVLSMSEVAGDVTHSLLHLDSRVWRTLRTLVLSPGRLTNEFIAGRHQHYLPPFRLYLVISLLFFGLSAITRDSLVGWTEDPEETVIAPIVAGSGEKAAAPETTGMETPGSAAAAAPTPVDVDLGGRFAWLEAAIEEAAAKIRQDRGRRLGELMLANAPKAMFVFLPLIAAVALLFYWRPRRLYAEHLVFFLHAHALLFLALGAFQLVEGLLRKIAPRAPALVDVVEEVSGLALVVYLPWYVYRAMRVVYGNARWLTLAKLSIMWIFYAILLGIVVLAATLYSALSL